MVLAVSLAALAARSSQVAATSPHTGRVKKKKKKSIARMFSPHEAFPTHDDDDDDDVATKSFVSFRAPSSPCEKLSQSSSSSLSAVAAQKRK